MFKKEQPISEKRLRIVSLGFLALAIWIVARLFILQIIERDFYLLFASNTHEISQQIHPDRGEIFFKDAKNGLEFPAAINKTFYLVYASPKIILASDVVSTTNRLATILSFDEAQKGALLEKLSERGSSYKVVVKKVSEAVGLGLKADNLPGIFLVEKKDRYYPEENLAASILGFTSENDNGELTGKYGLEGFDDKLLRGRPGLTIGEKSALGSWITFADRTGIKAENGPDVLLTIDRALQNYACARLAVGYKEYEAKSATLVLMNPLTGQVLAMCSLPDFDPNNYSKVDELSAFNNTAIFTPYEPGSVFKPITMAVGLDLGLVAPDTTFVDPCLLEINGHKIRNAQQKCYGKQTMTEVLEKSINTGVVWVEDKIGNERFYNYVKKFGFGEKTGIPLNTEVSGDVSSLQKPGAIFGANGSFGQGLTVTPLQIAAAYSAIANNGKLMKPIIVDEERYSDGHHEKTSSEAVEQVISPASAHQLLGM
ncbi:MAG: penicillin-binding protein 2, partial [Patescibacteria group bacterium]